MNHQIDIQIPSSLRTVAPFLDEAQVVLRLTLYPLNTEIFSQFKF